MVWSLKGGNSGSECFNIALKERELCKHHKRNDSCLIWQDLYEDLEDPGLIKASTDEEFKIILFQPKNNLQKLSSFHDLDLFSPNTASNIKTDQNLVDLIIHSRYFSRHSFYPTKNSYDTDGLFNLLHVNV